MISILKQLTDLSLMNKEIYTDMNCELVIGLKSVKGKVLIFRWNIQAGPIFGNHWFRVKRYYVDSWIK